MAHLGMGLMRLPLLDENDFTNIDYEQVNQMVDAYMDAGILAIHLRLRQNCHFL